MIKLNNAFLYWSTCWVADWSIRCNWEKYCPKSGLSFEWTYLWSQRQRKREQRRTVCTNLGKYKYIKQAHLSLLFLKVFSLMMLTSPLSRITYIILKGQWISSTLTWAHNVFIFNIYLKINFKNLNLICTLEDKFVLEQSIVKYYGTDRSIKEN